MRCPRALAEPAAAESIKGSRWTLGAVLVVAYSAALIAATWYAAKRSPAPPVSQEPAHVLWAELFSGPENSYIVPSDAGFNLLEDLSRRPAPLAEYISGNYQELPLSGVDAHSASDLRSQQLTPFVDLQIAAAFRSPD